MFSHIMIGSSDIPRSKKFYDALLGVTGCAPVEPDDKGRLRYVHDGGVLMITPPIDGNPATGANGGTIGFKMPDPEQVHAWHDVGCANGGTTCEDPPGERNNNGRRLYLAYMRDPDGNKLCALHLISAG
ncbi:MAG: VOC family protein [Pseudomonadota bacterium]